MTSVAAAVALIAALGLAAFSVVRGTWAVGGSDSSCYGLMADAFARGELQPTLSLAVRAPWPDALRTFAPGGFIPSPVAPAAASPICAPGFSLLLAPFRWMGGPDGIFLLMPIVAALLVWFAYVVARRLTGGAAGALAAVATATAPIVLFQAVQPMNDITTAMLWVSVVAAAGLVERSRWCAMGAATGLALLVRPNLAPVAGAVAVWVILQSRSAAAVLQFAAAAAPGVVVMMLLNWMLYGSPVRVGYGSVADLFSPSYVATNVVHYGRAAIETLTPFPLLALAAPWAVRREDRPLVWLSLGIVATTVLVYLFYRPFDEWWYLRFLLPATVASLALASATFVRLVRRRTIVAIAMAALAWYGVREGIERQATALARLESRFRQTGQTVRDRLPVNALFFTVWQSGTVRYHAGREAILWDSLDPAYLDAAVVWVREQGYEPFLVLERWEEPLFRTRFDGSSSIGALDWPPRLEINRQVRIYAPADRRAYLSGETVTTERVYAQ